MKLPVLLACLLLLPAVLLLASGCGGSSTRSTTVIIPPDDDPPPPPPGPLMEIEPNDDALDADYIGEIWAGDYLAIQGHITECCPDPFDGFAFYATEPVEVIVTLTELDQDTDLDFALYDPYLDEIIAAWETDAHPETGSFYYDGVGEFHLVVASYFGDSSYVLELDVLPLDPMRLLTNRPGPSGPDPDGLTRQRFRAYHAAPEPEPTAERVLLEEREGALPVPIGPLLPLR